MSTCNVLSRCLYGHHLLSSSSGVVIILYAESTLPAVKYHSCQIQKSSQGLSMLPRNRTANLPSNSVPMTAISHMVTGLVIPQTRHYKYSLCDLLQKLDCYQHCKIDGLSSQQQCYFLLAHYIQTFEQVALTLGGSFKKLRNLCSLCFEGRDSLIDVAVYNIGCVDTKVRNRVSESTCSSIEVHDSCLACQRIKSLIKHSEGKNVFEANTTCENGMLNLVVEHHSKGLTKKDEESFESTLNQAVYLGVDILRLMLTVRDVRTCTVYYFPSNDVFFGVVAIKLSFVVQLLQFQCTFEEISADKVENHIKSTIQCHQKNYLSVFKDLEHNGNNVRYNTAVWLEHDAIKEEILIVFRAHYFFHDWTSIKMTQYQSSSSFIFLLSSENGMHVFAKCPIYPRVNHTNIHSDLKNRMKTLSKTKQSTLMHSPVYNLLETVKFGGDKFFYLYPRLHGPLSREEAKKYLADFFCYTVDTLKLLHSLKYYHCDVRLENICFSIDNPFRAVLIDIDHFYDSEEKDWQKDFSDLSKKSCLYSADPSFDPNKTDWRQLGYTLVWILCPGSALTIHELELESFSDRLCKVENLTLSAATFWGVIITSLIQGEVYQLDE